MFENWNGSLLHRHCHHEGLTVADTIEFSKSRYKGPEIALIMYTKSMSGQVRPANNNAPGFRLGETQKHRSKEYQNCRLMQKLVTISACP